MVSMSNSESVNLEDLLDKEITVQLKGGRKLRGTLTKYDEYMNLVLKKAKEQKHGEFSKEHEKIFLKGGNIQTIIS